MGVVCYEGGRLDMNVYLWIDGEMFVFFIIGYFIG